MKLNGTFLPERCCACLSHPCFNQAIVGSLIKGLDGKISPVRREKEILVALWKNYREKMKEVISTCSGQVAQPYSIQCQLCPSRSCLGYFARESKEIIFIWRESPIGRKERIRRADILEELWTQYPEKLLPFFEKNCKGQPKPP